jgi:hypothetical protein
MSLEVYTLVPLTGAMFEAVISGTDVGSGVAVSVLELGVDVALAAMLADMLDSAGSTSLAICVGRRTRASPPRSWKVSYEHPLLLRPHVKVLFLPAFLQGVIAMPELGLSASRCISQLARVV